MHRISECAPRNIGGRETEHFFSPHQTENLLIFPLSTGDARPHKNAACIQSTALYPTFSNLTEVFPYWGGGCRRYTAKVTHALSNLGVILTGVANSLKPQLWSVRMTEVCTSRDQRTLPAGNHGEPLPLPLH